MPRTTSCFAYKSNPSARSRSPFLNIKTYCLNFHRLHYRLFVEKSSLDRSWLTESATRRGQSSSERLRLKPSARRREIFLDYSLSENRHSLEKVVNHHWWSIGLDYSEESSLLSLLKLGAGWCLSYWLDVRNVNRCMFTLRNSETSHDSCCYCWIQWWWCQWERCVRAEHS